PRRTGPQPLRSYLDHGLRGQICVSLLRSVPRCRRLGQDAYRRQAHLSDGSGQYRRGDARGRARHRGRLGHDHGEAGHALPRHLPAREGHVRHADLRVSSLRRIRDDHGGGAERLARRRKSDVGKPHRLQARRLRRRPHLFRAKGGATIEERLIFSGTSLLSRWPGGHKEEFGVVMGEFAIGQGVPRFEDPRLIRGGGRYVDDVQLPGTVRGVVLRSQHAHAKITKLDVSAAKAAPGVLAVLTAADIKAAGWQDIPSPGGLKRRDGSPMFKPRYPILADDRVRWVGDYVAFVVAETLAQALDALELIEAEYEPLPAVTSTEEATKADSPKVWEAAPDNIGFVEFVGDKAATDAAFAKADHVVKQKFVINRVTAATMEPRGAVGDYNATDRRYTLYTSLQRPHPVRGELARMMGVTESKVRIITGDTGGSFGMKSPVFPEMPLCLLASKLTGRPVKWISTRTEAFLSDAQARDNVTEAELALDKDGHFLGMRVKTVAAIGAYLQTNMPAFFLNAGTLAGTYRTPAIHVDITAVYTHTNPIRPYRGNGRPESAFVIERIVDCAADQLGIDPAELRRRNYVPPSAMPFKTALTFTWDSGEFEKNMDLAMELGDVKGFKARRADSEKRGKLRGLGISNTIERAGAASLEGAEVRFDRDGSVTMFSGSNSQGQGHETTFKQIV